MKQDYQIAREQAKELFDSLQIQTTVSAPIGDARDGWPSILYHFTFSKGGRSHAAEYRLGVGHVKLPKGEPSFKFQLTPGEVSALYTLQGNPGAKFRDKSLHASLAAKLAKVQKITPQAFEVFACLCREASDAHDEGFENWCANFGMDVDSIKAKEIYDHCAAAFHPLRDIAGADAVAKLAEFSARF